MLHRGPGNNQAPAPDGPKLRIRTLLEVRPNIDVNCYMVTRTTGRGRICSKVVAITF